MINEFVEKLIERFKDESVPGFINLNRAIRIANELAEKYKNVSDTNAGKWIPVSERLPEESGEYLTYVDYADETFIAIDEIDCDGIRKEWNCTPNYHVIAWQPLPQPYKGE